MAWVSPLRGRPLPGLSPPVIKGRCRDRSERRRLRRSAQSRKCGCARQKGAEKELMRRALAPPTPKQSMRQGGKKTMQRTEQKWSGASGNEYTFVAGWKKPLAQGEDIGFDPIDSLQAAGEYVGGVYIVVKETVEGFKPIDIGTSDDLVTRVAQHEDGMCWRLAGATELHYHLSASPRREAIEADLLLRYGQGCECVDRIPSRRTVSQHLDRAGLRRPFRWVATNERE